MLNAHTATRTFREMQFDIKAFLDALYAIIPAEGEEDKGLVEIKWADGSVDVVPTFELIKGICNSTYMRLLVGGVAELIPEPITVSEQEGKYYRDTMQLLIKSTPLKTVMGEIGSDSEDLDFIKGLIQELVADTVVLPDNAKIARINVSGSLTTINCNVNGTTMVGSMECDEGSIKKLGKDAIGGPTLDLSNLRLSPPMRVIMPYNGAYDLSMWSEIKRDSVFHPLYKVTDQFRLGLTPEDISRLYLNRTDAGMSVEVPVYRQSGWMTNEFDYVRTPITPFHSDKSLPFPELSPPGVSLLYPLKTTSIINVGHLGLRLLAPDASDREKIVNVQNPTGMHIVACNAWSFGVETPVQPNTASTVAGSIVGVAGSVTSSLAGETTETTEVDSRVGDIETLNVITIPPYSAIDFLFNWDIRGGRLEVYMLPMISRLLED